jgi:hypothetical protein
MKTFEFICKKINHLILEPSFKERFRSRPQDFTRKRALSFELIVFSILDLAKKSLQITLNELFTGLNINAVTKQAFSLSRHKVTWIAFKVLHDEVVDTFYGLSSYRLFRGKYLVIAMDGSSITLSKSDQLVEYFGKVVNQFSVCSMGRISLLYDVLNKMTIDVRIVPCESSEKVMAIEHLEWLAKFKRRVKKKIVLLFDRGYPCIGIFLLLKKFGIDFVCRAQSKVNSGLISQLGSRKDGQVMAEPNRQNRKKITQTWLREEKLTNKRAVLRCIRTSKKGIFLTSLKEIGPKRIERLYSKRWGIEVNYRTIKADTLLENFSGKKPNAIFQEIYATNMIQNLARILEFDLSGRQTKKRFLNHREVLGIIRLVLRNMHLGEKSLGNLMRQLKINWERERRGRKYPRAITGCRLKTRFTRLCYA